jgi:hypothetical protein
MTLVRITDEIAQEALDTLRALAGAYTPEGRTDLRRERAATNLLKLYQTQERYGLHPQTPQDFERALQRPGPNNAKALDELTTEELLALQAALVEAEFRRDDD